MKSRLPILARLASLKAQGVTVRTPTSHQQVEGAEGLPGGVDMKLTEKEVAAFRRRFLGGNKDGMGTLTQAAAAVAPTSEHALRNRQNAFKGLESLGLSAAEIANIEGGGSAGPSRRASKEQVGDGDGNDEPPPHRAGPGMLKRS